MRNTDTVLAIHRDRGSRRLPLERVYKHLFDPELFLRAYGKIYRNTGAMTRGTTRETVDGMDLQKIQNIIDLLRQERYVWKPVRRTEIPKANGKKRPLGIPTWSDKLVQEAVRTLLEPYYEQRFSQSSHGFRPNRGCHTALGEIRKTWKGTKWLIEGDIKGCFDNIDHTIMLDIIRRDIRDGRLVKLIDGLLKAGYMENHEYHDTASGTPQGGIISPLLANIYLDQLDQFVEGILIPAYTWGKQRGRNPEYERVTRELAKARRKNDDMAVVQLRKELRQLHSSDPMDPEYRRLRYTRYADDFLLGFAGPKNEAEVIRDRLAEYLRDHLKLDLSIEKTLVTHAETEKAQFLGYEITVSRANTRITKNGTRGTNGNISLLMPRKVVAKILGRYSSSGKVIHQAALEADDDYTIITRYQAVLRGLYNYYCMAINVGKRMAHVRYILETSLTKTLAHKHRMSVPEVFRKYGGINKVDNLKTLQVIVKRPDKDPLIAVFGGLPLRWKPEGMNSRDFCLEDAWSRTRGGERSEIIQRLLNDKCELCAAEGPAVRINMHHIRQLRDLDIPGQTPKLRWQRIMSAKKRKSLAVCTDCHKAIHAGRYDGPSPAKLTGEPGAMKTASPVRGGVVGKGDAR
jgi:group II intron reverse transcriptase/maturase